MGWISRDYICIRCENEWEDFVLRSEENDQKCPKCGALGKIGCVATNVATYSLMSKDDQAKHLRKRSRDHTKKMLKKDPTTAVMSRHIKVGKK